MLLHSQEIFKRNKTSKKQIHVTVSPKCFWTRSKVRLFNGN
jgi:hypothetical protein